MESKPFWICKEELVINGEFLFSEKDFVAITGFTLKIGDVKRYRLVEIE